LPIEKGSWQTRFFTKTCEKEGFFEATLPVCHFATPSRPTFFPARAGGRPCGRAPISGSVLLNSYAFEQDGSRFGIAPLTADRLRLGRHQLAAKRLGQNRLGWLCPHSGHVGEERLGPARAGLAVGLGLCGAGTLSPRQAVGDERGDGGVAGVVGTPDWAQEAPERDQRGEEAVQPAGEGGEGLGEDLLGEEVGEGPVGVRKDRPWQEAERLGERGGVARAPGGSGGPMREEWSASLFASEAGFASDLCSFRLAKI
jgi:hypothetical protein